MKHKLPLLTIILLFFFFPQNIFSQKSTEENLQKYENVSAINEIDTEQLSLLESSSIGANETNLLSVSGPKGRGSGDTDDEPIGPDA